MAVSWVSSTALEAAQYFLISTTRPQGLVAGDTLLAAVFARSPIYDATGWTRLIETAVFTQGSISQHFAVFKKDVVDNETSSGNAFVWEQLNNARIGVIYAVLSGVGALIASGSTTADNATGSWTIAPPVVTADADGQMAVLFASTIVSSTGGATVPAGSTVFGYVETGRRLLGAYQSLSNGQATSGSFNLALTGSAGFANGNGAVALLFSSSSNAPATVTGRVAADGPLGAALVLANTSVNAVRIDCPGPLGAARVRGFHDFSAQVADLTPCYVMDLTTPDGDVRAPISSWQATLQINGRCYVQCVIPACEPYLDAINAATAFTIYRTGSLPGVDISYQMASAAPDFVQLAQGPNRYTALMSGYSDALAADAGLSASLDRPLLDVRSVFVEPSGMRIRCAVDWLLQPGMRAVHGAVTFDVGVINYYAAEGDQYMDVQEAEVA